MATETITQTNLPAPFIETMGKTFGEGITRLGAKPIDTTKFQPTVAYQGALGQAGQQAAASQAGLGQLTFDATTGAVTGVGAGSGAGGAGLSFGGGSAPFGSSLNAGGAATGSVQAGTSTAGSGLQSGGGHPYMAYANIAKDLFMGGPGSEKITGSTAGDAVIRAAAAYYTFGLSEIPYAFI